MRTRGVRGGWLGLLAVALAMAFPAPSTAASAAPPTGEVRVAGAAVTASHLANGAEAAELTLTLTQPLAASAFTLPSPDRVILDLPQVDFLIDPASLDPSASVAAGSSAPHREDAGGRRGGRRAAPPRPGLIASVRFGSPAPGRSRIVIGLSAPARIIATTLERDDSGRPMITLRLNGSDQSSFEASARAPATAPPLPVPLAAPSAPPPAATKGSARPVIVIDPGHGGPDTGAERNGIVEKDLTFAFSLALAARLEAGGRYAVVLTRSSDIFIPLSERVAIARRSGAALMISVHADTLPEASRDATGVGGATVYTVSDRASDAYAATVAAKENAADAAVGIRGEADRADVGDILFDLTRQETRALSHVFARTLVNYWKEAGRLNKNPQRSAGFVVLKAPDVPSVLVELGYLSSPTDAAAFQSAEWRARAAGRMAEAVEGYFAERHAAPPRQLSAGLAEPTAAGPK